MKTTIVLALLAGTLGMTSAAQATLLSRLGGQAYYDTELKITWLADANLAASNTFGVSGINADSSMTWNTAEAWVQAMDAADYLGLNNWRLPTTMQPDSTCSDQSSGISYGYNCTGSEMGHLYAVEGISSRSMSPFIHVQASALYWSGTQTPPLFNSDPWAFSFHTGVQGHASKDTPYYAWAVRDGDVATVPEPATALLMGIGALGLGLRRRSLTSYTNRR